MGDGWEAEVRAVVGVVGALLVLAAGTPVARAARPAPAPDVLAVGADYNQGKPLPLRAAARPSPRARAAVAGETPAVGTVKDWLALDDAQGEIYFKSFTLQAVTDHMEVWVADDLGFPAGDCRDDGRTVVTRAQAEYLAGEFETRMYPRESAVFSVPPDRDGSAPLLREPAPGYWGGEGDKVVTLVDNVRDASFYDTDNRGNLTRIAGFFYSVFNQFVDRNVMSIDAYDWLHQTGADPPDHASADLCTNAPARPFLYESVFAHEYQHLLEYYEDPDEGEWTNEGLSDWAQTLTGYVDPRIPITEQDFDSHIQCFLGWLGVRTPANTIPRDGGPENSVTLWIDQGDDEVLCDYGAAYTMMEFLRGRYGESFMTVLHRTAGNGFAGLQEALNAAGSSDTPAGVLHDWAAMVAVDGVLDRGARFSGGAARRFTTPTLDARINWETPEAYDTPGAPPNGSDYVRLRDAGGRFIGASDLDSLTFDGTETLEPRPIEWVVDPAPAGRPGDPALHSGSGPNLDRSIVRSVTVPAGSPTLTFQTRWLSEVGWDFGFVQVSSDGGRTYTSLANAGTTSEHHPGAIRWVVDNLPGFTGDSGGWRTETFDLSAYAGRTILLAFRYITDSGVDERGWWIDDVTVGDQPLSDGTTLDGWRSTNDVRPDPVAGYTLQIVGYTSATLVSGAGRAFVVRLPLDAGNRITVGRRRLRRVAGALQRYDVIAALVMQDDPTEMVDRYARYSLIVDGVVQPGG